MTVTQRIRPCLWFDSEAEEAARYYAGIFKKSRIVRITRYPKVGHEIHGKPEGSVLTVEFELDGQRFTALNGGPHFKFNEAVSLEIHCDTQEEIDYYWNSLSAVPEAEQCGWLKDRFGVSWQVVPYVLHRFLQVGTREQQARVTEAFLQMKKFDIATLERAYEGAEARAGGQR
jgi:predicted 3-demethylubiquinone-9 3-methyltransferase (glyoxalase superfamily)